MVCGMIALHIRSIRACTSDPLGVHRPQPPTSGAERTANHHDASLLQIRVVPSGAGTKGSFRDVALLTLGHCTGIVATKWVGRQRTVLSLVADPSSIISTSETSGPPALNVVCNFLHHRQKR